MLQEILNSKTIKMFYGKILPILFILLILGVASLNNRPQLFGSVFSDLFIRLFLCFWFCVLYIRLSRYSTYSTYPNIKWSKPDISEIEKYFYIGGSLIFSGFCGLFTFWIIHWFFPSISSYKIFIAVLNFAIILFPTATQYWHQKL